MPDPQSPTPNPFIFDRRRLKQHRDRAAARFAQNDFMFHEGATRLVERLADIRRVFPRVLDLGAHDGYLREHLTGVSGIEWIVQTDISERLLRSPPPAGGRVRAAPPEATWRRGEGVKLVCDEEFLPFADHSFDLVMSLFSLHWINDLPGTLIQINRLLKPGGLLIAMLPGGETLKELRQSFEQAELAASGGLTPRISPFVDTRDGAMLLQRAGFTLPVADSEMLSIHYDDPMKLIEDLRHTGETNTLMTAAKGGMRRAVLYGAMEYYQAHFAEPSGKIRATCEIVTLTGWKKDA